MKKEKLWLDETMMEHFRASVRKYPNEVAIYDGRMRLTYKELDKQVTRCAAGLIDLGMKKNSVISLQLPNWGEFVIFHYAATLIGAITNPLIPIYRENEIGFMTKLAETELYVAPKKFRNFDYEKMIQGLSKDIVSMKNIIIIGEPEGEDSLCYAEWMSEKWEDKHTTGNTILEANEVSEIIFTSGTTGEPKGVLHTHNTLTCATKGMINHLDLREGDVVHMGSTFAHQTGFLYGVRMPMQFGGKGVYQDIWNPEDFVKMIEKEKINVTFGATPFLHDLINAKCLEDHDISSLRIFVCAGAPIPKPLLEEALKKLPNCKVLGAWGQTEDAIVTVSNQDDPLEVITSSDGVPISEGMEIRIVDEGGLEVPRGNEGNLEVRGSFVFVGYAKRLELTQSEFNDDWFITGDLASISESGHLKISGRSKDMIIRGGENIPVAYVEDVLHAHPLISVASVVAIPCPRLQERACACVVLKEGSSLTLDELKVYLEAQGIAKPYWPEYFEVVAELPRTASGKIKKFQLREEMQSKLGETKETVSLV